MSDLEKITLNNIKYIREDLIVPCTAHERAFLDEIRAKFKCSPGTGTIYGIGVVLYPSDFPGVNLKELVNE